MYTAGRTGHSCCHPDFPDYNLQDGWNSAMWGHTYEYVFPQIYQSENATRDRMPAFFGITKILKVEVMHRVTDYYGPIVYSHFADLEARYMPDTQKEVYSRYVAEKYCIWLPY